MLLYYGFTILVKSSLLYFATHSFICVLLCKIKGRVSLNTPFFLRTVAMCQCVYVALFIWIAVKLILNDVRNVEMYEGNPGLASQVIGRFFSNIFFMVIEIDGNYIANVVFIAVTENAIAISIESICIPILLVMSNLISVIPKVPTPLQTKSTLLKHTFSSHIWGGDQHGVGCSWQHGQSWLCSNPMGSCCGCWKQELWQTGFHFSCYLFVNVHFLFCC